MTVDLYPNRDAWLAGRRQDGTSIGASEVSQVLGISPYGGPWDLWTARQRGEVSDDADCETGDDADADPVDVSEPTTRGNLWEPFVRDLAGLALGVAVVPPGAPFGEPSHLAICRNDDRPWVTCSPDGWADCNGERVPAELKTAAGRTGYGWGKSGSIITDVDDAERLPAPPHYLTQVWWQLEATGAPFGYLIVLTGAYRLRWFRVERNAEIQRQLVDAVGRWRERHLIAGHPPDVSASDACVRYYRELYAGRKEGERVATEPEAQAIRDLAAARAAKKAAETAAADALSRLLPTMGAVSSLTLPDSRAYASRDSRGVVKVWGL